MSMPSDERIYDTSAPLFEGLEERLLLTTLVGGDVFEYHDLTRGAVRIALYGDIIVELIAGDIDRYDNRLVLGDMPGHLITPSPDWDQSSLRPDGTRYVGGGGDDGGSDGVQQIGPINIDDPVADLSDGDADSTSIWTLPDDTGDISWAPGSNEEDKTSIQALASQSAIAGGGTYGFNIIEGITVEDPDSEDPDEPGVMDIILVQLLRFDEVTGDATVIAHLHDWVAWPLDDNAAPAVTAITAADFRPELGDVANDGRLYFVATYTTEGGDAEAMFTVDVTAADVSGDPWDITRSVKRVGNMPAETTSIAFEVSQDSEGVTVLTLYAACDDTDAFNLYTSSGDADFTLFTLFTDINRTSESGSESVTTITGIEFINDDPTVVEKFMYAVGGGQVMQIRVLDDEGQPSGEVYDLGPTPDQDDDPEDGPVRGAALDSLAWDPILRNPFTGGLGALLATDVVTDDLVFVDHRPRFVYDVEGLGSSDLFAIYVSQASPDSFITIASVDSERTPPYTPMDPNSRTSGEMQVDHDDYRGHDPFDPNAQWINYPVRITAGSGDLYLGAKTEDVDDGDDYEDLVPIIAAYLNRQIGTRPRLMDDWDDRLDPDGQVVNLSAGLKVGFSVLDWLIDAPMVDRVMGHNLDIISGMAIDIDGNIFVIDSDGVDGDGIVIHGDQISMLDPVTGRAPSSGYLPKLVLEGGASLTVMGLDYRISDYWTGAQELFAAVRSNNWEYDSVSRLGVLDPTTGEWTAIGGGLIDIGAGVSAMAFSPQQGSFGAKQGLFVIGLDNWLYEIDPDDPSQVIALGPVQAQVFTAEGSLYWELLEITSMDFDENGNLFGHDKGHGRLVNIEMDGSAGTTTVTPDGSLRPTVGGISYDVHNDRWLAADSVTGYQTVGPRDDTFRTSDSFIVSGEATLNPDGSGDDDRVSDSAVLMQLLGTETESAAPQSLDRFFFDGTITGRVQISGSVNVFYAGWILTGDTWGTELQQQHETIWNTDNFVVGGDLRNLLTDETVGGWIDYDGGGEDPPADYFTGVQIRVGGKLGWLDVSRGDFLGEIFVDNDEGVELLDWLESPQVELESVDINSIRRKVTSVDTPGYMFEYARAWWMSNDSPTNPQYLGSIRSGQADAPDVVQLAGQLWSLQYNINSEPEAPPFTGDFADHYAIGLMAGQEITVQMTDASELLGLTIYDPDGRIIYENISDTDQISAQGAPYRFTTDRPGVYTIGVTTDRIGIFDYELSILGAGDIALGGLTVGGNMYAAYTSPMIDVAEGSIGAVDVAGAYTLFRDVMVPPPGFWTSIALGNGDLRSVEALAIDNPYFDVPAGSIGLIRSSNTDLANLTPLMFSADVGGDVQVIEGEASYINMNLNAGGGLGIIRAAEMPFGTTINLNTDGYGNDGILDLIDVLGDFLGPQISTGPGGNVRYIRVGGEVYIDPELPSGTPQVKTGLPGQSLQFIDDSGAVITVTPLTDVVDAATREPFDIDPFTGERIHASLECIFYPIRSGESGEIGGGVLIEVVSTGGIHVTANDFGLGGPIEIGRIRVNGDGRAVVIDDINPDDTILVDPLNPTTTDYNLSMADQIAGEDRDVNVFIEGDARIDVFEVIAGPTADGFVTTLANTTGGELVNIYAATIGNLYSAGNIGLAEGHVIYNPRFGEVGGNSGPAINPILIGGGLPDDVRIHNARVISNSTIFSQQNYGIVAGHIMTVRSEMALGNFMISEPDTDTTLNDGNIGRMEANYLGVIDHTDGVFEGIAAPIYLTGELGYLQIGEGVAPSGRGGFARSGVFAEVFYDSNNIPVSRGTITDIVNQGPGSDIRGDIFGMGGIRRITLNGGSIIDCDISTGTLAEYLEFVTGGQFREFRIASVDDDGEVVSAYYVRPDIDQITINGRGGIIGAHIGASNVGSITIHGGFGLFNSTVHGVSTNNHIGQIRVNGFGLRDVDLRGGGRIGDIIATGDGSDASTLDYSPTVRFSENYEYDPLFGVSLSAMNDIHLFLGTSVNQPMEMTGVLENVFAHAHLRIGTVSAYQILRTPNNRGLPMQLTSGSTIGGVSTRDMINGLTLSTGSLGYFRPGGDVYGLDMTVAGDIEAIVIKGNLADDSRIEASGPNGSLRSLIVRDTTDDGSGGNFEGSLSARGKIGTVIIDGDMTGDITVYATKTTGKAIKKLKIGGDFKGSLDLRDNVGTISVAGSMGVAGDVLRITGNLGALKTGSDLVIGIEVAGDVGLVDVAGEMTGDLYVGGDLKRLKIVGAAPSVPPTDIVTGVITVLGKAGLITIDNGSLNGLLTVGLNLSQLRIFAGDLGEDAVVTSSFGDIGLVEIRNGDLNGKLRAVDGVIGTVRVGGSDLGDSSLIAAAQLNNLYIDGSMKAGARIEIDGALKSARIGVDVEAGAAMLAGKLGTLNIRGSLAGTVEAGVTGAAAKITVGVNVSGSVDIDGDAKITVGGDVLPGGSFAIGGDLVSARVNGSMGGVLIVDGKIASAEFDSLAGAVITSGFDAKSIQVTNDVNNSLIQIGASAGEDGQFAAAADLNETARMATLKSLIIGGVMTESIVASAGSINSLTVSGGMDASSVSSGLSIGSTAIADLLAAATPLASGAELNAARGGADRSLFRGDINQARVGGFGLVDSHLTAGVDPGASGDFGVAADNGVVTSLTGGDSLIGSVKAVLDAASGLLADGGVNKHRTANPEFGDVDGDVSYTIADLAVGMGSALEAELDVPLVEAQYKWVGVSGDGHEVTISISGPGTVTLFDEAGADTDDKIDTIVITGANGRTKIDIETSSPGAVTIGRILTADDVSLGRLTFDGDLVGDGVDGSVDLWLDGPIGVLAVSGLGGADMNWDGRIGGDVNKLQMTTQGVGNLRIGGHVKSMSIVDSAGLPLLEADGGAVSDGIIAMTAGADGFVWVFDTNTDKLYVTANEAGTSVTISDPLSPEALTITAMDFGAGNALFAVASIYSVIPTEQVNTPVGGQVNLSGLAVDSTGRILAVDSSTGEDVLVEFDPATGWVTPVGALRGRLTGMGYTDTIVALAFDSTDRLFALINDADGDLGARTTADGLALVLIETTDTDGDGTVRVSNPAGTTPAIELDGGGFTDEIKAMAFDSADQLYAIRRDAGNTQDELITIAGDGSVAAVGGDPVIRVSGNLTHILGIGFNAQDDLVAYDNDGVSAGLVKINTNTPNVSSLVTQAGVLSVDVDAFALGVAGGLTNGFAYDTDDGDGAILFKSPGLITTLGSVDGDTGEFFQLLPLADDASGAPLSSAVLDVAIDIHGGGNAFVLTADGRLLEYNINDGSFVKLVGTVADANTGDLLDVTGIDFNDDTGELVGMDRRFNTFFAISTADATASPKLEGGVVDGDDLSGLTYDANDGTFITLSDSTHTFMRPRGMTADALTGVTAVSIGSLSLGGGAGFDGRVVTTGNTFGSINVTGDFGGSLISAGDIGSFSLSNGDFAGALDASGSIGSVTIRNGAVLSSGLIRAGDEIGSLSAVTDDFAGAIEADVAGKIRVGVAEPLDFDVSVADMTAASIRIRESVGKLAVTGPFHGSIDIGSAGMLQLQVLTATADVSVAGDVGVLSVTGDVAGAITIGGSVAAVKLNGKGSLSGQVVIGGSVGSVNLYDMDGGLLSIGQDAGSIVVGGGMTESLISIGVWIGDDGVYNTDDDLIYGGSLRSGRIKGDMIDSAIVAGVLPSLAAGPGVPVDKRLYTGNAGSSDMMMKDAADAGGVLTSTINSLWFGGNLISTLPAVGKINVAAAADGINRVRMRRNGAALVTRDYGDPIGAPEVVRTYMHNDTEVVVIFSEELNTGSLVLSIDDDDDGVLTGGTDVNGSITVTDADGVVMEDLLINYTTQVAADGTVQGVLRIRRPGVGFTDDEFISIRLSGDVDSAILDRSGLRSALRDMNRDGVEAAAEDRAGSVFNGDGDFTEGGDETMLIRGVDASDNFWDPEVVPITVDGGVVSIFEKIEADQDADVYGFTGVEGDFLSVQLFTTGSINMAVFMLDDQGTPDYKFDDTFEALARHERPDDPAQYAAFELPEDGQYYVVVSNRQSASVDYELEMRLASTDDLLDGEADGLFVAPDGDDIAYVSNEIGPKNQLGANTPKQLVYLDFDGGVTTEYAPGQNVEVDAFNVSLLDPTLYDKGELMIEGGGAVIGIVDNIMTIYSDTPASHPDGQLNVQRITTLAEWEAATEGLYFTTVDPATWDLDATEDFTTVFIGTVKDSVYGDGGYGIASTIDMANMSKGDNALVFAQKFADLSHHEDVDQRINEYSIALANTAAHELGHVLGLNHQPTNRLTRGVPNSTRPTLVWLLPDDPNNDGDLSDTSFGYYSLMGYTIDTVLSTELLKLGTNSLTSNEFWYGHVDTTDLLLRWLS